MIHAVTIIIFHLMSLRITMVLRVEMDAKRTYRVGIPFLHEHHPSTLSRVLCMLKDIHNTFSCAREGMSCEMVFGQRPAANFMFVRDRTFHPL
jgi:hypothetical protein